MENSLFGLSPGKAIGGAENGGNGNLQGHIIHQSSIVAIVIQNPSGKAISQT